MTLVHPVTVSFQRPELGSRNFIKYKSSRFMLKYNVLMIMKKLDSRLE
ncbi:hypothetical protein [Wolbachia endosymbiont of Dactylopius coccus]